MNKMGLRTAIKQAETDANRLSDSLQEVERHLVFRGFQEDDTPQVTICGGDEIILVYRGSEIHTPESQTFKIKTHEVLSFIFAFSAVIFAL